MKPPKKIYLVWAETGYFITYHSIQAAVYEYGDSDIYEATPKLLGKFERTVKVTKKVKKK